MLREDLPTAVAAHERQTAALVVRERSPTIGPLTPPATTDDGHTVGADHAGRWKAARALACDAFRRLRIRCVMVPTLIAILGALLVPGTPAQDTARSVSGRWTLNTAASQDPRRTLPTMHRDSGGGPPPGVQPPGGRPNGPLPAGGGRGRPPGGGPGGPGGGREVSPRAMAAQRALMAMALEPPRTLRLEDTTPTVLIVWADRDSIRIRPNGSKVEQLTADSVHVEYRAQRRHGRLELERRVRDAGRITETFFLSRDQAQLITIIETTGTLYPLRFQRVYDRAPRTP